MKNPEHNPATEGSRTAGMPAEMQVLLNVYPRESWEAHAGFKTKTKNWLGAHQMFRRLISIVLEETEKHLDKQQSPIEFSRSLSNYGSALVANLHGHHAWEDRSYFPELSAADPRFDAGFELLQNDHRDLDAVLDSFIRVSNRFMLRTRLEDSAAEKDAGRLLSIANSIDVILNRHLSDEEELAIPIILHHRLRG